MADGVGAVLAPPHAAALESIRDHRLAGALHRARANLPTVGHVARIVHAMVMVLKVAYAVGVCCSGRSRAPGSRFCRVPGRLAQLKLFERGQHRRTSFVLQLMTPTAD